MGGLTACCRKHQLLKALLAITALKGNHRWRVYQSRIINTPNARPPYSTPFLNLFDFGRPCARRPASARLPRQSDNSFQLMLCSRPEESFQVRPALESKVATSDSAALVYFC